MSDEVSRYEINRRVRNILVSHNANMTKISYTSSNRSVCVYGSLCNNDNSDFNMPAVKALVSDIMNIPRVSAVQFDLDNWVIVAEPGELIIMKGQASELLPWGKEKEDSFL